MQYDIEAVWFIYEEGRKDRHIFSPQNEGRHTLLCVFIFVRVARTTQKLRTTCDTVY